MSGRLIDRRINGMIEEFLGKGGRLIDLSMMLGVNLSTLWRYRTKGFTDPYGAYLIAKASGQAEEEAWSLARELCVANGGRPDAPITMRVAPAAAFREQVRELIREELSKAAPQTA